MRGREERKDGNEVLLLHSSVPAMCLCYRRPVSRRTMAAAKPASWVMLTWTDVTPSSSARSLALPAKRMKGCPEGRESTETSEGATPPAKPVPRALTAASLAAQRPARNAAARFVPAGKRVSSPGEREGALKSARRSGRVLSPCGLWKRYQYPCRRSSVPVLEHCTF